MTGHAVIGSAVIALAAKSGQLLVSGLLATDTADPQSIVAQGGVFALAIGIGAYMLRRGDQREKEQHAQAQAALTALNVQAQADLAAMRSEMGILRAELLTTRDKLVDALVENAKTTRDMLQMTRDLTQLRTSSGD